MFADDNLKHDEKWQKVLQTSRKHSGKWRNCLLQAISPFPAVLSKESGLHTCKNQGLYGKGLNWYKLYFRPKEKFCKQIKGSSASKFPVQGKKTLQSLRCSICSYKFCFHRLYLVLATSIFPVSTMFFILSKDTVSVKFTFIICKCFQFGQV